MVKDENTTMIRAGGRTYFFDLKETQEGKRYLVLTETRWRKDGQEYQRSSMVVFPDQAEQFSQAVSSMTAKII